MPRENIKANNLQAHSAEAVRVMSSRGIEASKRTICRHIVPKPFA